MDLYMKSYEEIAENVFRRRDEYKRKNYKRDMAVKYLVKTVSAVGLMVCICITLSFGYVLAAGLGIIDDFVGVFEANRETHLSPKQEAYIEEVYADIGESISCNGVTVTVNSAITDGKVAYIYMDVEAPENIDLESLDGHGLGFSRTMKSESPNSGDIMLSSSTTYVEDDNDGKKNTVSLLIESSIMTIAGSDYSFADGYERTLNLSNLHAYKEEYPYSEYTITEGEWCFKFKFTEAAHNAQDMVEMIRNPVTGYGERLEGEKVAVKINSVKLKALGVQMYYSFMPGEVPEAVDVGPIKAVMKDGSEIAGRPKSGVVGSCSYIFESPIVFEDLDYILINGETRIYMPEKF